MIMSSSSLPAVVFQQGAGSLEVVVVERRLNVVEMVLRFVVCGLGVIAAILVGTDKQVKSFFSVEKKTKFTDMKALVFLVIWNAIAAIYSLVQCLRCAVRLIRGSVLVHKKLAWVIFSFDQVLAYVTFAAAAAALQSAVLAKRGQTELQWMKVCDMYGKFCTQAGEGVSAAVVVSITSVALSCMSAFNLFRLYHG